MFINKKLSLLAGWETNRAPLFAGDRQRLMRVKQVHEHKNRQAGRTREAAGLAWGTRHLLETGYDTLNPAIQCSSFRCVVGADRVIKTKTAQGDTTGVDGLFFYQIVAHTGRTPM